MSRLTKLGFALVLVFSISLLGLAAELLYLLHCRRRRRLSGQPELGDGVGVPHHGPPPRELLHHVLFFKHRSRVEPACAAPRPDADPPKPATGEAEEECDLARWRAMCLGPSRALYTINEDLEEEEEEEEETPFATPCASPVFYTPSSSPPHGAAEDGGDAGGPSPAMRPTAGKRVVVLRK
ncbi:hypothetical protein OPV22_015471 [Ensete ventricosum]|uniref:Methyltransferase n=1 Tax=Ensete ventricosum TaxID=4639 RepID=A0AAV8RD82_ENSVE|nr:hypothetical protein OPV22_015471 [Ensete ventricosum]RWW32299.1 hypothetical protein GW17_00003034 [Ensete ventricosum]RWW52080.1 hypothetical protein BHE74_00041522 [Ensete ventricosum]